MSSRLMRLLLKLYPRRIRDRYGDELIDLQRELEARGELSGTRLLRDMLAGALLVRPGHRRAQVIIGTVIVGLVAAGAIIGSRSLDSSARASHGQTWRAPAAAVAGSPSCFVAGGSSCSLTPCTEFAGQPSADEAAAGSSLPAGPGLRWRLSEVRRIHGRHAAFVPTIAVPAPRHCIAYPRGQSQHSVFVSG